MPLPTIVSTSNLEQIPQVHTPRIDPDAYGYSLGKSIQGLGENVARVHAMLQEREDEQILNETSVKMNNWTAEILNGSQNPDGSYNIGILQTRGADARGSMQTYRQKYNEFRQEMLSGIPARQRNLVASKMDNQSSRYVDQIAGHEATQVRNGQYLDAKVAAASTYDAAMSAAVSDEIYNQYKKEYAEQEKQLSRWESRPTDVKAALERLDTGRINTLISQGFLAEDIPSSSERFALAKRTIDGSTDLNDEQKAKLLDHLSARFDAASRKFKLESKMREDAAKKEYNDFIDASSAEITKTTTAALLDPNSDLVKIANSVYSNAKWDVPDKSLESHKQDQVKLLMAASLNRAKPPREFPVESDREAYQGIMQVLYSDPGKAAGMIETACSNNTLSSAHYTSLKKEAVAQRSDQVNRALVDVIPKFWSLYAQKGIKPKDGQNFYYSREVIKPGTPDYAAEYGSKPGYWDRKNKYEKATPQQLEKVVEGVKKFCLEHPEADTETIVKAVLRPTRLAVAAMELDDRLPYILLDFIPQNNTRGEDK